MNYKAYLQGEHWQLMRRLRREVDNEQCAVCGSTHKLNVHHKTYERIGVERLGDLITLCYECHGKYHNKLAQGNFNVKQQSTVATFHKKEELREFEVDESYSRIVIRNNTYDDYDLIIEGEVIGKVKNQRVSRIDKIDSGLRELIFKCGSKEKRRTERIDGVLTLELDYSEEELQGFEEELRRGNFNEPLTIENKNLLNKVLEIKGILPRLEKSGFISSNLTKIELLKVLLKRGYNLNVKPNHFELPLQSVAAHYSEEVFFLFIKNGAKPTKKCLEYALSRATKKVIEYLLEAVEFEPSYIFAAASNKDNSILEMVLKKGADINFMLPHQDYPIHRIVRSKSWDKMKMAMEYNLDKGVVTQGSETIFMLVIANIESEDKLLELLDLGFSPEGRNIEGRNSLFLACNYKYPTLINRLVDEYSLEVDNTDRNGNTPLMYAVRRNSVDTIRLLVSKGADINAINDFKDSVLKNAIIGRNIEVVKYLLKEGADPNVLDRQGNTVLVTAIINRDADMVRALVEGGIDTSIKTEFEIASYVKTLKLNEISELLKLS